MSDNHELKLTIITATFNSEACVEETIQSIASQTYANIEYLIVDGASSDGTLDIVRKYADVVTRCISEPDKGIYDAFNKGVAAATGDVIYFLNSDDYLYDPEAVRQMMELFHKQPELEAVYGNIIRLDPDMGTETVYGREIGMDDFQKGYMPPHQGLFMKKRLFADYGPFDLQYRSSSDFDFVLRCFKDMGERARYVNRHVAVFRMGGASTGYATRMKGLLETERIIKEQFGTEVRFAESETVNNALFRQWLESLLLKGEGITARLRRQGVRKVAVFGSLKAALYLQEDLAREGLELVGFIDNNEHMHGKTWKGVPIRPYRWLLEESGGLDAVVVSLESARDREVIDSLKRDLPASVQIVSWKELAGA